jgi:acyl carrier protein
MISGEPEAMFQDILDRVRKRVAEVLAIVPDDILPDSKLVDDLGAESLDLVELMYMLEQEFDIRLSRDDLSLSAQLGIPEDEIHDNEVLTARALELLRERFPKARDLLQDGITRRHLAALLTVEEVAQAVRKRLAGAQAAG